MRVALDILRGLSAYVLIIIACGLIFWLTIPGFRDINSPLTAEIKMRSLTAVMGGGALFVFILIVAVAVTMTRR